MASKFNPPGPPAFESMSVLNEHDFNNREVFTATGNNLTVGECKDFKEVLNMSNFVVKSINKGGVVIVQSREQYL